jgi:Flp pilus assembly protein TadB
LPLIVGLVKDRRQLAIVGFVVAAVCGLILGLILAVLVAIGFTLAILLWKPAQDRRTTQA